MGQRNERTSKNAHNGRNRGPRRPARDSSRFVAARGKRIKREPVLGTIEPCLRVGACAATDKLIGTVWSDESFLHEFTVNIELRTHSQFRTKDLHASLDSQLNEVIAFRSVQQVMNHEYSGIRENSFDPHGAILFIVCLDKLRCGGYILATARLYGIVPFLGMSNFNVQQRKQNKHLLVDVSPK